MLSADHVPSLPSIQSNPAYPVSRSRPVLIVIVIGRLRTNSEEGSTRPIIFHVVRQLRAVPAHPHVGLYNLLSIKTTRPAFHEFQFEDNASCAFEPRETRASGRTVAPLPTASSSLYCWRSVRRRASLGGSCALILRISYLVMAKVLGDLLSVARPFQSVEA